MSMPLPDPPREMSPRGRLGAWLAHKVDAYARTARHPLFWVGAREMAGISVGLTAWAFMTGVAMIKSGMSITEAVLMSLLVFAGSAQLAAIPLIAAGAPLWVILATAFCVNLRFVVFSLHLRDYFMFLPRTRRLYLGYFTGDVTYVLYTRRFPKPAETETQRRAQMAYLCGGAGQQPVHHQRADRRVNCAQPRRTDMKKFNDPVEKAGEWLGGTDEGAPRWWLVLKVLAGVVGLGVLVYIQVAPHLTR